MELCAEMFGIGGPRLSEIESGDVLTAGEFTRVGRCPAKKVPKEIVAAEVDDIEASIKIAVDDACRRDMVGGDDGWSETVPTLSSYRRISQKSLWRTTKRATLMAALT